MDSKVSIDNGGKGSTVKEIENLNTIRRELSEV